MISSLNGNEDILSIYYTLLQQFLLKGMAIQPYQTTPNEIVRKQLSDFLKLDVRLLNSYLMDKELLPYFLQKGYEKSTHGIIIDEEGLYTGIVNEDSNYGLEKASPIDLVNQLEIPVILVLDGSKMGMHIIAQLKQAMIDTNQYIKGYIISSCHLSVIEYWTKIIEKMIGLTYCGYIPIKDELLIEEKEMFHVKHLTHIAQTLDIVAIKKIMEQVSSINVLPSKRMAELMRKNTDWKNTFCLGIPVDELFLRLRIEERELLNDFGANLVEFSPLHDTKLLYKLDGVYFSNINPSTEHNYEFIRQLSTNKGMIESIRSFINNNKPLIVNGSAYFYMTKGVEYSKLRYETMIGLIPGVSYFYNQANKEYFFSTNNQSNIQYTKIHFNKNGLMGKKGSYMNGVGTAFEEYSKKGDSFTFMFESNKDKKQSYADGFMSDRIACLQHKGFLTSNIEIVVNIAKTCKVIADERLSIDDEILLFDE